MTSPRPDADEQRWRDPHPRAGGRRIDPEGRDGRPDRHRCPRHRARDGRRRTDDRHGCAVGQRAAVAGAQGRRVRAEPPHPPALLQHRRRRRGGDLARRDLFFHGPVGRGPRPGRAVPRPDDAAVRDRGAADRAVPGPLRRTVGAGRSARPWRSGPSCAGCSPAAVGRRLALALPGRARRPRLLQGVRRDAGRRRTPPPPAGLHAGQGQRPGVGAGPGRGRRLAPFAGWPRWPGPSGCCATRFLLFVAATVRGGPAAVAGSTPSEGEGDLLRGADEGRARRAASDPPAVATRLRANWDRGGCRASSSCSWRSSCRENPIDGWSIEVLTALVVGGAASGQLPRA